MVLFMQPLFASVTKIYPSLHAFLSSGFLLFTTPSSGKLSPRRAEFLPAVPYSTAFHLNPRKRSILHPDVLMRQQGSKDGVTVKEMQVVIKQYQNIASVLREVKSAILLSRPIKNLS